MEELLKKLNIKETEDLDSIKDQLEIKQIECLERLNTAEDDGRRQQLKETLREIEDALSKVLWMIEKMNKGLSVDDGRDANQRDSNDKIEKLKQPEANNGNVKNTPKKPVNPVTPPPTSQTNISSTAQILSPKLQRAYICLEDSDWSKADSLLEDVLNENPTNAKAYIGKMMVELHIPGEDKIREYNNPLKDNRYYKLALKYADSHDAAIISGYNEYIEKTISYKVALKSMLDARSIADYNRAADQFDRLDSFQDAPRKREDCLREVEKLRQAELKKKAADIEKHYQEVLTYISKQDYYYTTRAIDLLKRDIPSDYKDSARLLRECKDVLEAQKYAQAKKYMDNPNHRSDAVKYFAELGSYKDSKALKEKCERIIQEEEKRKKRSLSLSEFKTKALDGCATSLIFLPVIAFIICYYLFKDYYIYISEDYGLRLFISWIIIETASFALGYLFRRRSISGFFKGFFLGLLCSAICLLIIFVALVILEFFVGIFDDSNLAVHRLTIFIMIIMNFVLQHFVYEYLGE